MSGDSHGWKPYDGSEYRRFMGESESAFFPTSKTGLGDMYLHVALAAPSEIMNQSRVITAWAVIRRRHPLLMSHICVEGDQNSAYFSFSPPGNAITEAKETVEFSSLSGEELIYNYMNGPRLLSNDHLSRLVISASGTSTDDKEREFDLLMFAPHFIGDGSSLHQCTHDLLSLLASPQSDAELAQVLLQAPDWLDVLPPALEPRLPTFQNRLAKAAAKVNCIQTLHNEIGGHVLSRNQRGPQRTVMLERAFTEDQTTAILNKCKLNNVTVNHALFALCNIAWGRSNLNSDAVQFPLMMYTAMNLRHYLSSHPSSTYWFLALTYFNIVLPSYLPPTPAVFWNRARMAKAQTRRTVQSPFLTSRALEMAKTRATRAKGTSGSSTPLPSLHDLLDSGEQERKLPPAPSAALMGLSLIGNLDSIYTRSAYPSIRLHSVRTASRQKAGGFLLLEHTFDKKLWFQLCYDENGFAEGHIERFWERLQDAVEEILI